MVAVDRKSRGAWYTPPALVDRVIEAAVDAAWATTSGPVLRVVDPACGDGRFLRAAIDRCRTLGAAAVEAFGVDIDAGAVAAARESCPEATVLHGDALGDIWSEADLPDSFDLVVGNPPFLSQLSSSTTRGGGSRHGGGPYADAAVEFLSLGARLVEPRGGRLGFVLPQSLLASRDAADVRRLVDDQASMIWSSWTGEQDFDAQVVTCALVFEFGVASVSQRPGSWASVVTDRLGVPPVPAAMERGSAVLADHGWLNANFRDEYYGLVPAVVDGGDGPPLVTSGIIDPGICRWGQRDVRFAKRNFAAPTVDLAALDARMLAWARRRLRPKVLVANQTRVLEAVADPDGIWLPGVPVVAVYPERDGDGPGVWEIAAVLTSPAASAWAWHQRGGTGLSATSIRVGPVMLGGLPWPGAPLDAAVGELRAGELDACARAVHDAYGIDDDAGAVLCDWWAPLVERALGPGGWSAADDAPPM